MKLPSSSRYTALKAARRHVDETIAALHALPAIGISALIALLILASFAQMSFSRVIQTKGTTASASILASAELTGEGPQLPLYFIKNEGQVEGDVAYYTEGGATRMYFGSGGIRIAQLENKSNPDDQGRWLSKIAFDGANTVLPQTADTERGAAFSYILGKQDNWKTDITSTTKLTYDNLWDGIDLELDGSQGFLKYTFTVEPGADPAQIKLRYDDADIALQEDGSLKVSTPFDSYIDAAPTAEQPAIQATVPVSYRVSDTTNIVTFNTGSYDPTQALVIDPAVLIWGSYLGSTGYDNVEEMAVDETGLYVIGYASASIGALDSAGGYDDTFNGGPDDGFAAKFSLDGTSMLFGTYIGGNGSDGFHDLVIDTDGNMYMTGDTHPVDAVTPSDFPTTVGAFDTTFAGTYPLWDLFVLKLNSTGTALVYSTLTGGDRTEIGYDIEIDTLNRVYITGEVTTWSSAQSGTFGALTDYFPATVGPDLTYNADTLNANDRDGFIGRLNADGSAWDYLGYIGGADNDFNRSRVRIDSSNNAYIGGRSTSTEASFPDGDGFGALPGYDQTYNGGGTIGDAVMVKVTEAGAFSYATYIGGTGDDEVGGMVEDGAGGIWFTGSTTSTEATFPVLTGPDLTANGSDDAYLTHIDAAGTSLLSSGFFGGTGSDYFGAVDLDSAGNIVMCGGTTSTEADGIPLVDGPDLDFNGVDDGYLVKMDAVDFSVIHAGYIGGDGSDYCYDVVPVGASDVYFGMETSSSDTTFPNGYGWYSIPGIDHTQAGDYDAGFGLLSIIPAAITVTESGGSTDISEIGPTSDDYTVVLESRPTFNVTVTIGPNAQQTTDLASLTFTPLNWDVPQTVTTTAVVDATQECDHTGLIVHTATSQDLNYDGISVASVVPNITDYCPGVTVTESGGSTNIAECGITDAYTVVLDTPPSNNVTIDINPDAQQTTAPTQLTFTTTNWDEPQTITVTAVEDELPEGAHTGSITHSATSTDPSYDSIAIASVAPNIVESCRITAVDSVRLAIEVSKARFGDGQASAVLLSREDLWIDAFVGTPLSTIADGPLLLNPTGALHPDVLAEIERVLPAQGGTIYLLGRERALANKVHDDLAAAGFTTIERLGGINRNATAELIAEEVLDLNSTAMTAMFLSENERLVDAMTVSAAAAEVSDGAATPILLSQRDSAALDEFTSNFIQNHPEITSATIVGGHEALPADIEDSIYAVRPTLLLSRLFGENRYGTARAIADTYFTAPDGVVVAGGERQSIAGALSAQSATLNGLVGALLAGGLAADKGQPLLISRPTELPEEIASYLTAHADTIISVTIVGNEADVSSAVEAQIQDLVE